MNDNLCSLILILIVLVAQISMSLLFFHSLSSQTLDWIIN
jgi:hypothetical protein